MGFGITGDMFKPFTNTKTCVLFLQKRRTPVADLAKIKASEASIFCVSEKPGKNKSGELITDEKGNVISDLPEITQYMRKNVGFN